MYSRGGGTNRSIFFLGVYCVSRWNRVRCGLRVCLCCVWERLLRAACVVREEGRGRAADGTATFNVAVTFPRSTRYAPTPLLPSPPLPTPPSPSSRRTPTPHASQGNVPTGRASMAWREEGVAKEDREREGRKGRRDTGEVWIKPMERKEEHDNVKPRG